MVTARDVAREAGVSPATVSRAFNNSFLISEETCQKVYAAARKLGYGLPELARKEGDKGTIVYLGDSDFDNSIAMQREALKLGYNFVNIPIGAGEDSRRSATESFQRIQNTTGVAGVLYNYNSPHAPELLRNITDVPSVSVCCKLGTDGEYSVQGASLDAGYAVTKKLIESGRKRVAFVTNKSIYSRIEAARRLHGGYTIALAESGADYIGRMEYYTDANFDAARELGRQMFSGDGEKPDAVIVVVATIAAGFLKGVLDAGVRVPEDVIVVAQGDPERLEFTTPPLPAIGHPDPLGVGQESVKLLDDLLNGRVSGGKMVEIPLEINWRGLF